MKTFDSNNDKKFSVQGTIIGIIGGTGILGSEYVKYLASKGASLIIGDVDIDRANALSCQVNEQGFSSSAIELDNTDEKSIINFFTKIRKKYDRLDVLINNAQLKPKGFYAPFEKYSKETLFKVIDGNLIGVTLACREACGVFLEQGYGTIINIASLYGVVAADQRIYENVENIYYPNENFSSPVSYAISKAGVVQLTKYLASYYRGKNIKINCITPGGVFDNHDEIFEKNYSSRTTIGRMANKDEYNGAVLFLASEASSYMNGANLILDGGWTII